MFDANLNPIEPFYPFCESIATYFFKRYKSDLFLSGLLLIFHMNEKILLQMTQKCSTLTSTNELLQFRHKGIMPVEYDRFISICFYPLYGLRQFCSAGQPNQQSPGNRRRLRRPEASTFLGNVARIYEVDNPKFKN